VGKRLVGLGVLVVILALGVLLGSALSQGWEAPEATAGDVLPRRRPETRVRVEVRNGAGEAGLARAATDVLRDEGFDVVFYGNAESFDRDSSVVLDRVGRLDLARDVADALGIPRVLSEPDSNLYLDATVVLGEDWTAPEPEPPSEVEAASLPWWHPRRWVAGRQPVPPGPVADPRPDGG
jgi:hypothetical protein